MQPTGYDAIFSIIFAGLAVWFALQLTRGKPVFIKISSGILAAVIGLVLGMFITAFLAALLGDALWARYFALTGILGFAALKLWRRYAVNRSLPPPLPADSVVKQAGWKDQPSSERIVAAARAARAARGEKVTRKSGAGGATRYTATPWTRPTQNGPTHFSDYTGAPARGYARIMFDYVDKEGNTSERDVKVKQITHKHIETFDYLRRAERTFLLRGIVGEIVVKKTGEILSVQEWLDMHK